jgi:hypothetical protein
LLAGLQARFAPAAPKRATSSSSIQTPCAMVRRGFRSPKRSSRDERALRRSDPRHHCLIARLVDMGEDLHVPLARQGPRPSRADRPSHAAGPKAPAPDEPVVGARVERSLDQRPARGVDGLAQPRADRPVDLVPIGHRIGRLSCPRSEPQARRGCPHPHSPPAPPASWSPIAPVTDTMSCTVVIPFRRQSAAPRSVRSRTSPKPAAG